MNRFFLPLFLGLSLVSTAFAQPAIRSLQPILNSASYIGPELTGTNAGIAQGSLFALFGSGFGAADAASQATTYPLPTVLGGVSAAITVNGTTTHAIMLNVYFGFQINAVLPSATPVGTGTITVSVGGHTSAPAAIVVVPTSFGVYAANAQGTGQAASTDPNFIQNSIIHTFHPGDVAILWGTGLGAVTWDETEPPPASAYVNLPVSVQVYVGTQLAPAAPSDYHGRSPDAGLDELVFTVPAGIEGCYVPVGVKAGGVMSNTITIAVSSTGNTCSDSIMGQDMINQLAAGQTINFGWIRLEGGAGTGDYLSATFNTFSPGTAKLASYGVSPGYCMSMEWGVQFGGGSFELFPDDLTLPALDAGTQLALSGPTGNFQAPQSSYLPGLYVTPLSTNTGGRVLWAGENFTVTGGGGANVGHFTANDTMPVLGSRITNISQGQFRPRNSDLTITWDPSSFTDPSGLAVIGGLSETTTVFSELQCVLPVAPGQFTIPSWVLSLLPPSGAQLNGTPTGYLWIGQWDTPQAFAATGLDKGLISSGTFALTVVGFQ